MRAAEAVGRAVEFAFKRWPRCALLALFTSPLWLNVGLQLINHWSTE